MVVKLSYYKNLVVFLKLTLLFLSISYVITENWHIWARGIVVFLDIYQAQLERLCARPFTLVLVTWALVIWALSCQSACSSPRSLFFQKITRDVQKLINLSKTNHKKFDIQFQLDWIEYQNLQSNWNGISWQMGV